MKLSNLNCTLLSFTLISLPATAFAGHVPGELLVKLQNRASISQMSVFQNTLKSLGAEVQLQYKLVPGLMKVKLPADRLESAEQALSVLSGVEYATKNFLRKPAVAQGAERVTHEPPSPPPIPPKEAQPTSWAADPKSNFGTYQNRTDEAWEKYKFWGDSKTIIAVIDTGVDYTHPDLRANMWRNPGESDNGKEADKADNDNDGYVDDVVGYDFVNNRGLPWDDYGHGTHVAGIAAAVGGNGQGISGQCPRCSVMALKFIGANGEGSDADAIRAMEYAKAHGASVINASWGSPDESPALEDAFKAISDAGINAVVAAGNDGDDITFKPFYPAKYQFPGKLTVAALYETNIMIPFWSNYGWWDVQLSGGGNEVYSTFPGGSYTSMSGTSMASPNVAGCVALARARRPDLNAKQVVELFRNVLPDVDSMSKVNFGGRADMMTIFSKL